MDRLFAERFTYDLWRAGSLATFGLETRYACIAQNRGLIRRHATGYCPGEELNVRPKPDCMAVMFWIKNEEYFWTHLSNAEFGICFPEITEIV